MDFSLSILKSAVQAQSNQISQVSVPSLAVVTKVGPLATVPPGKVMRSSVDCPAGSVATEGGQGTESGDQSLQFVQSLPHIVEGNNGPTPIGWIADEFNPTTDTNQAFSVIAVCATVPQGSVSR